jgi:hypothetical protein
MVQIQTKYIVSLGISLGFLLSNLPTMATATIEQNFYSNNFLDEEEEDRVNDKKDSTIKGIGTFITDTVDKNVILDDTLIYEDFDIIQMKAPAIVNSSNKPQDKDIKMVDCFAIRCGTHATNTDISDLNIEAPIETKAITPSVLFPNPARANSKLTITTGDAREVTIQVMDMSGKIVDVVENVLVEQELRGYISGTYFVLIIHEDGEVSHKKLLVN